jgi:hypothetical protein
VQFSLGIKAKLAKTKPLNRYPQQDKTVGINKLASHLYGKVQWKRVGFNKREIF